MKDSLKKTVREHYAEKMDQLEALARDLIGDGQTPDLFFVTDRGTVVMVTTNGEAAYDYWRQLARRVPRTESALENRSHGVLCAVEPVLDDSSHLTIIDDYHAWRN